MGRQGLAAVVTALILLAGCATANQTAQGGAASSRESARVLSVTDGDTIKVEVGGRQQDLRAIGMDTPELRDPRKPVQCFAREASDRAHQLLDGQSVELEADPSQDQQDDYGRIPCATSGSPTARCSTSS